MIINKDILNLMKGEKVKGNEVLISKLENYFNAKFKNNPLKREDLNFLGIWDSGYLLSIGLIYLYLKVINNEKLTKDEKFFIKFYIITERDYFYIKGYKDELKEIIKLDDESDILVLINNPEKRDKLVKKLLDRIDSSNGVEFENILSIDKTFSIITSDEYIKGNKEEYLFENNITEIFPSYYLRDYIYKNLPDDFLNKIKEVNNILGKGDTVYYSNSLEHLIQLVNFSYLYKFLPKELYKIYLDEFISIYSKNYSYTVADGIIDIVDGVVKFEKDYLLSEEPIGSDKVKKYYLENVRKWWD